MVGLLVAIIIILIIAVMGVMYYFMIHKPGLDEEDEETNVADSVDEVSVSKPKALSQIDTSGNVYTEAGYQDKFGEFIGQACTISEDCPGYVPNVPGALKCCNGACTKQRRDYNGAGQCPDQCIADYGLQPGTCPESSASYDINLSSLGGECTFNSQCRGYMEKVPGTLKCCGGKCETQIRDYLGAGTCPSECQARAGDPPGTCLTTLTRRAIGQSCVKPVDCSGHMLSLPGTPTCCDGVCVDQIANWAGTGVCPQECKKTMTSQPGTCEYFQNKYANKFVSNVDDLLVQFLNA